MFDEEAEIRDKLIAKSTEKQRQVIFAAKQLERSPDFQIFWGYLKAKTGYGGSTVSPDFLLVPHLDGMSKALAMARNDGHQDIFYEFDALVRAKETNNNNE